MASIMKHLLTQPVSHRAFVETGKSGTPVYDPPISSPPTIIFGRIAMAETLLTDENGKQITSGAKLYTEHPVGLGDLIGYGGKEWIVIKVVERLKLRGERDHLEVSLK